MLRFGKPNLIRLYDLNDEDRLVSISLMDIGTKWKRVKYDEIICILLITIFLLFFFAQSLTVFLVLLTFELVIGVFALIKNYKERREKTMERRRIFRMIKNFLIALLLGGAKVKW